MYKEAILDCKSALRINPKDSYSIYNRGLVYISMSNLKNKNQNEKNSLALKDFTHAIVLDPNDPEPLFQRALLFFDMFQFIKVLSDFEGVLEHGPTIYSAECGPYIKKIGIILEKNLNLKIGMKDFKT